MVRRGSWLAAFLGLLGASCGGAHDLAVSPTQGRQSGGEPLRIQGDDFLGHGPVVVYVGDQAAKQVIVESPWLIRVLSPQCDVPGVVDVRIAFGDGGMRELPAAFTCEEEPGVVLQPRIGS